MPPQPFIDLAEIDTSQLLATREEIYQINPHRHEFAMLDGLVLLDRDRGVLGGIRNVGDDEFWVRGHIPGRPIFPGVLMIETAAQLVSYYMMSIEPEKGFLGFGGVENVKFRGTVVPGQQVLMLGKMLEIRRRRCVGATQGFVDGQMVYEGTITGMWL